MSLSRPGYSPFAEQQEILRDRVFLINVGLLLVVGALNYLTGVLRTQFPPSWQNTIEWIGRIEFWLLLCLGAVAFVQIVTFSRIWAVARETFAQCIRMRVAVAFLVILAVALATFATRSAGDQTLAGRIQTYLAYSVGVTGLLLSVVTVLVTVGIVSGDVQNHHVMLLATKPLARWQYILGRWLGVVLLIGLLLAISGTSIYLVAQQLRSEDATSPTDRRIVETEVFAAREKVRPKEPDYLKLAVIRMQGLQERDPSRYEAIVNEFVQSKNMTREQAQEKLLTEQAKAIRGEYEALPVGRRLVWEFEGLKVKENMQAGTGEVDEVYYDPEKPQELGVFTIVAPKRLIKTFWQGRPVIIDGYRGMVLRNQGDRFDIMYPPQDMRPERLGRLKKGSEVEIQAEPTIQFQAKVKTIGSLPSDQSTLWRRVEFWASETERVYALDDNAPVNTTSTLTIPAIPALQGGRIFVRYANLPPRSPGEAATSIRLPMNDVALLYRVGSFEGNFVRGLLLMMCQLAFLAALGLFFGSFLSLPVAAMACLVLLGSGFLLDWLASSLKWQGADAMEAMGLVVIYVVRVLMPSIAQTSPSDRLVQGLVIGWQDLGGAAALTVTLRATVYLTLACIIFQKRELARVQV